jgi:hypothetical protein
MGPTALLPLRRKACWGFFRPEKSDGFGQVWTRELGYRRRSVGYITCIVTVRNAKKPQHVTLPTVSHSITCNGSWRPQTLDTTSSGVPLPCTSVYMTVLMSRICPVGSTDLSFGEGCRCDSKGTSFQFSENYLLERFEVLTAVLQRTTAFWNVTLRRGVSVSRRFEWLLLIM